MTALTSGETAYLRRFAETLTADPPPSLTDALLTEVVAAAAMIPEVLTDLDEARNQLALTRAEYASLLAAARAAVAGAAADDGDTDPLGFVRAVLAERGQLPAPGAVPVQVVADARSALCLTGWSS